MRGNGSAAGSRSVGALCPQCGSVACRQGVASAFFSNPAVNFFGQSVQICDRTTHPPALNPSLSHLLFRPSCFLVHHSTMVHLLLFKVSLLMRPIKNLFAGHCCCCCFHYSCCSFRWPSSSQRLRQHSRFSRQGCSRLAIAISSPPFNNTPCSRIRISHERQ